MRDKIFVKGSTSDEKFKSIETTLRHFSHRLSKKVVGLLPATPVIRFVVPGDDGVVLNMICPADGRVTQGCIYIESDEKRVILGIQLNRREGATTRVETDTHDIKANVSLPFRFNLEVKLGDMITLYIEDPEKVKNVWIGFLYEIGIRGLGRKEFVLDQIEKMEKEDAGEGM